MHINYIFYYKKSGWEQRYCRKAGEEGKYSTSVKSKLEFMAFDHNSFLGCYGSMTDLRGFKVNKP